MRNWISLLGLLALGLTTARLATAADKDGEELAGGYTIESGEKFGVPEPEERIKGSTVRITEDRVVVTDKDKKEVYGMSYVLDTATKPWKITMTAKLGPSEGTVAKGLIEKKGDTVRLIYALPGGEMPTDFKTGEKQLMFVMKNVKK